KQNVALYRFRNQIRLFALPPRVFVGTRISEGPPVEFALLDVREVVRDQIVTQGVTLLDAGPQNVATRIPVKADGVTGPRSENLVTCAIGIIAIDRRALRIFAGVDIRRRSNADVHLFALAIEQNGASPVAVGKILVGNKLLTLARGYRLGIV